MRAVVDTDVMVAAMRSDTGASRRILVAALNREFSMAMSVPLVIEYEAVLTRPEHLAAARLSTDDVRALLDQVVAVGEPIELAYLWRPALRDPNDDMVLETAVNGHVDALVTFNERDFAAASQRFNIQVMRPQDMVALLRS